MPDQTTLLCAICGIRPATTTEHVPPKAIFLRPRPSNLVTVPACFPCNNKSSATEEEFGVYLAILVADPMHGTSPLWRKQALRTLDHNNRLARKVNENLRLRSVRTPAGLHLGKVGMFQFPARTYISVIEKTIRGLYYHHYGDVLGPSADVHASMSHAPTEEFMELTKELKQNSIGGDALIYRFGRAVDSPLYSIWSLQFYSRNWASGHTNPSGT